MTNINDFEFIQPPHVEKEKNQISISIYKYRNIASGYAMVIHIGKDVAKKVGLSKGSNVQIGINKHDPRKIILKKSDFGMRVCDVDTESPSPYFSVAYSGCGISQIKPEGFPDGEVKYTIDKDNNILLEIERLET